MGCRSDYMEPNEREVEMSRVLVLIDELNGKEFKKENYSGYHPDVYSKGITQDDIDKATANLCSKLKQVEAEGNVSDYSLELQIWWRDHKEADKRHDAEDKEEKRQAKLRKDAAKQLTKEQRKALGIDEDGNSQKFNWLA